MQEFYGQWRAWHFQAIKLNFFKGALFFNYPILKNSKIPNNCSNRYTVNIISKNIPSLFQTKEPLKQFDTLPRNLCPWSLETIKVKWVKMLGGMGVVGIQVSHHPHLALPVPKRVRLPGSVGSPCGDKLLQPNVCRLVSAFYSVNTFLSIAWAYDVSFPIWFL